MKFEKKILLIDIFIIIIITSSVSILSMYLIDFLTNPIKVGEYIGDIKKGIKQKEGDKNVR